MGAGVGACVAAWASMVGAGRVGGGVGLAGSVGAGEAVGPGVQVEVGAEVAEASGAGVSVAAGAAVASGEQALRIKITQIDIRNANLLQTLRFRPLPRPFPSSFAFLKNSSKRPPPSDPRPLNRGGGKFNLRFFCPRKRGKKNRLKKAPPPCPNRVREGGGWGVGLFGLPKKGQTREVGERSSNLFGILL